MPRFVRLVVLATSFTALLSPQSRSGAAVPDNPARRSAEKFLTAVGAAGTDRSTLRPTRTQSVQEAEQHRLVRVAYGTLGGSSGDVLVLTLTKVAGPVRLTLSVPPGIILHSSVASVQDMVISGLRGRDAGGGQYEPTTLIVLTDSNPVRYILEAYCANFHRDNPRRGGTGLRADARPDVVLECILKEARRKRLSVVSTQAAVWMWTDRVEFREMNTRMPISATDWKLAEVVDQACEAK
jgi:hypothetical protein